MYMNGMGMNGMGMNGMGMNGMGMNGMLMNGMGMNNPMNMMNMIQMFNMYNMMNQNNNINNQNMNNGMNNQNNSGINMPRNVGTINVNPYQNYNGQKSNVTFESSAGFKMNMPVPYNIKLKDLFKTFVQKAGLSESVLGKKINFIFNALYVNPFEEKTLAQYNFPNFAKILVLDVSNLLGGKI